MLLVTLFCYIIEFVYTNFKKGEKTVFEHKFAFSLLVFVNMKQVDFDLAVVFFLFAFFF